MPKFKIDVTIAIKLHEVGTTIVEADSKEEATAKLKKLIKTENGFPEDITDWEVNHSEVLDWYSDDPVQVEST